MNKKSERKQDLLFAVIFTAAAVFNIWRLRFGFPSTDESFFVTIMHRLWLGDLPIKTIYNPVQFAAMIGLPLFSLYMKVVGSTDGIFLFYRLVYVVMMGMAAVFTYLKTRKNGWIAVFPPLIIVLFSSLQIMDFSYGSIGLFNILMMSLLLSFPEGHVKRNAYLAGVFYSLAVLCTPHLAILYFAGSAFLVVSLLRKSEKHRFAKKCWLLFTLGAATMAVIYVIWILMRIPLSAFIGGFGNLFLTDARNNAIGPVWLINTLALFKMIWLNNTVTAVVVPVYALLFLFSLYKKRTVSDGVLMGAGVVLTAVLLPAYRKPPYDYGMISFVPLGLLGLAMDKDVPAAWRNMFLCGLGYVFMINISSNTILNAAQHASTVCMVPSVLMAYRVLSREESMKKLPLLLGAAGCICIACQITDRLTITWQDGSPLEMHEVLTAGPAKGVVTEAVHKQRYDEDYTELKKELEGFRGNVLFFADHSWMYLMLEQGCHDAVYSTWFDPYGEHVTEILGNYYKDNSGMVPDLVFLPKRNKDAMANLEEVMEPYGMVLREQEHFFVGKRESQE